MSPTPIPAQASAPKAPTFRFDLVAGLTAARGRSSRGEALQMLIEGERRMTESGVEVWLAGLNPGVLETVRNTPFAERLGRERMLFNARVGIERYQTRRATGGHAA